MAFASVASMAAERSPYINKVYEYRPAPGQFMNTSYMDPEADLFTLGGWGGYVVYSFGKPVANVPDSADFEVLGNAFFATGSTTTGSFEPGIIYVSRDDNGNGIPDDTWYEIAGSEFDRTDRNYSVTYYRPADSTANVMGVDCYGDTLYVMHNSFHGQAYYPHLYAEDSVTFFGSRLPSNLVDGAMTRFAWGYADNAVNGTSENYIDIDWAVDADGHAVHLKAIDFVRIQTGISLDMGLYGELSTEIAGVADLHPEADIAPESLMDVTINTHTPQKYIHDGMLLIRYDKKTYNVIGVLAH